MSAFADDPGNISRPAGTRSGPPGAGLVLSTTKAEGPILIDPAHCRAIRMRKSLLTSGRLLDEQAREEWQRVRAWFVTLTYRDDVSWSPNHIRAFMRRIDDWCRSRGLRRRAEWCLELTRRGRPHYHVIVWVPSRFALPKADKRGWWLCGMTRTEVARKPVAYLAKYASKFSPDMAAAMPKGARSHGVCGLNPEGKREVRWWKSPLFAREALGERADVRKAPGGYLDRMQGAFVRSPWVVTVDGGGRVFVHKVTEYTNVESNRAFH